MLNPPQFIKKRHHRRYHDRVQMQLGNIMGLTAVMGWFRKPSCNCGMILFQGREWFKKIQDGTGIG